MIALTLDGYLQDPAAATRLAEQEGCVAVHDADGDRVMTIFGSRPPAGGSRGGQARGRRVGSGGSVRGKCATCPVDVPDTGAAEQGFWESRSGIFLCPFHAKDFFRYCAGKAPPPEETLNEATLCWIREAFAAADVADAEQAEGRLRDFAEAIGDAPVHDVAITAEQYTALGDDAEAAGDDTEADPPRLHVREIYTKEASGRIFSINPKRFTFDLQQLALDEAHFVARFEDEDDRSRAVELQDVLRRGEVCVSAFQGEGETWHLFVRGGHAPHVFACVVASERQILKELTASRPEDVVRENAWLQIGPGNPETGLFSNCLSWLADAFRAWAIRVHPSLPRPKLVGIKMAGPTRGKLREP